MAQPGRISAPILWRELFRALSWKRAGPALPRAKVHRRIRRRGARRPRPDSGTKSTTSRATAGFLDFRHPSLEPASPSPLSPSIPPLDLNHHLPPIPMPAFTPFESYIRHRSRPAGFKGELKRNFAEDQVDCFEDRGHEDGCKAMATAQGSEDEEVRRGIMTGFCEAFVDFRSMSTYRNPGNSSRACSTTFLSPS